MGSHQNVLLLRARSDVELTLAAVGVAICATDRLGGGHALRGAHAPPRLRLADGPKLALATAVCRGEEQKKQWVVSAGRALLCMEAPELKSNPAATSSPVLSPAGPEFLQR